MESIDIERLTEAVASALSLENGHLRLDQCGRRRLKHVLNALVGKPTFRDALRLVAFLAARLEVEGGQVQPARALVDLISGYVPMLEQIACTDRLQQSRRRNIYV